jgi:ATP-binding cassette subfamily D (ALD) long-chain fatty acid import protein
MIEVFENMIAQKYSKVMISKDFSLSEILGVRSERSDNNFVRLIEAPIVTPSGELLIQRLSFTINPGDHLLITGVIRY